MTVHSTRAPARPSRRRRTRHLVARRGATAVLVALCALPLVGVLALAVDIGVFYRARRNQQNAVDAAALAWAHERYSHPATGTGGADTRLTTAATAHGYTNGSNGTLITSSIITWGATTNAIRVTIRDTVSTFFSGVLGRSKTVVAATAVATFDLANSTSCVYALDPDDQNAMDVFGNGTISMTGCGVQVNSTANPGLLAQGNVTLLTASTGVAGTYQKTGNGSGTISPAPVQGTLQAPDPLGNVAIPATPSGCTYPNNVSIGPPQTQSLNPGVYCGTVDIKGTANLASGTYYFLRGIDVSAGATVNGTNVNLINTTRTGITPGPINMNGGPTLNLSADTTVMKGILIYQSPLLTGPSYEVKVRGNNNSTFRGTIYLPNSHLDMSGNTNFTVVGSLVANTLEIGGNGNLTIPVSNSSTSGWFSIKRVTLVD